MTADNPAARVDLDATPRTWPENAWPTAAELADWLSRCTSAERLDFADKALTTTQRGALCFDQDHEHRLAGLLAEREAATDRLCDGLHKWREDAEMYRAERDEARAERDALRERVGELENALNWDTTCLNCSSLLDASYAEYVRAETAAADGWDEGYEAAISDTEARSAPPGPNGPVDPTQNPYRAALADPEAS